MSSLSRSLVNVSDKPLNCDKKNLFRADDVVVGISLQEAVGHLHLECGHYPKYHVCLAYPFGEGATKEPSKLYVDDGQIHNDSSPAYCHQLPIQQCGILEI